jgi:tripartite-type tricarboxylate transporter receptor subunit TctC
MFGKSLTRCVPIVLSIGLVFGVGAGSSAMAADLTKPAGFPKRSVTMIVPFGPGGGSDQMARALGAQMEKAMGVSFRYVNKSGAGGMAALPDFAVAPADGYTILQHHDAVVTGLAAGKHSLKIGTDIVPICIAQADFSQLYINGGDKRFSDWKSLVAHAKKTGGSLKVAASSGQGSHEHTTVTQVSRGAGIKMTVVPFGDPGERISAILGGHVDLYYEQPGDAESYVKQGKLKPVLSILKKAPKEFADTPALTDVGLDFEPTVKFRGLWIRGSVPKERREYFEKACKIAWNTKPFQAYLKKKFTHIISEFRDTENALELTKTMHATYSGIFKELGIVK